MDTKRFNELRAKGFKSFTPEELEEYNALANEKLVEERRTRYAHLKTRKQYMNKEISHREYFAQFVNAEILSTVKERFGNRLKNSTDEHLNDIPLGEWDAMQYFTNSPGMISKLKAAGEGWSLSVNTCILKEAARQIKVDLSDGGPYATQEDGEIAKELQITINQLRRERAADDF